VPETTVEVVDINAYLSLTSTVAEDTAGGRDTHRTDDRVTRECRRSDARNREAEAGRNHSSLH
jgi:hypothetical protein